MLRNRTAPGRIDSSSNRRNALHDSTSAWVLQPALSVAPLHRAEMTQLLDQHRLDLLFRSSHPRRPLSACSRRCVTSPDHTLHGRSALKRQSPSRDVRPYRFPFHCDSGTPTRLRAICFAPTFTGTHKSRYPIDHFQAASATRHDAQSASAATLFSDDGNPLQHSCLSVRSFVRQLSSEPDPFAPTANGNLLSLA